MLSLPIIRTKQENYLVKEVDMEQIHFLGEEDFLPVMATENKAWREACVTSGYFKTYDGKNMHYYIAKPEHPRAVITIVHGFCEFWVSITRWPGTIIRPDMRYISWNKEATAIPKESFRKWMWYISILMTSM